MTSHTSVRSEVPVAPVVPARGSRRPLGLDEVRIDPDSYWGRWQYVNAAGILPHADAWMSRLGWIENFRAAAQGRLPADRRGREFTDSDVYKLLEAMIWEQRREPADWLRDRIDEISGLIAGAQEGDGYLNTMFGRPGQRPRYSDLEWGHELYDYGHLFQAAVAALRCGDSALLVEVARRAADHVCEEFGPDGRNGVCGHPEVELGLVELARATGEKRYRRQAELFLDRRGRGLLAAGEFGAEYFQDDVPIREATVLRGHAVRAVYLAAAAVDVAMDGADDVGVEIQAHQWRRTTGARTYLTGGMGSRHQDESFGADFELPSEHAYSETCAAVGALMWTWRLALATGEVGYADFAERVLHNVVVTSPAPDGHSFFYANTLHQRTLGSPGPADEASQRASSSMRAPWFEVSCCPPNIARTVATLASYVGWKERSGITLATYGSLDLEAELRDGVVASLSMRSAYPDDGVVSLRISAAARPWELTLRIPTWATGATVTRNDGTAVAVTPGWYRLPEVGRRDEVVELRLPMEPHFVPGDPRIDSARGAVAVERGPLVYCLESTDIDDVHVDRIVVDASAPPRADHDGGVLLAAAVEDERQTGWPYGSAEPPVTRPREVRLLPYYRWGERGPSTMRVWLRTQ